MKNSVCLNPYEEFFGFGERFLRLLEGNSMAGTGEWMPSSDIYEDGEEYVLGLEIPGVRKEDLNIKVKDRTLTVSGERKRTEKEGIWKRREIAYGKFERAYTLPENADSGEVEAKLRDGILELRVKKLKEKAAKKIEIK